ncbi:nuclear receptor subfamily 0 group B member 2-like [Rhinatrema bivittatum]|uniref:nuclear receptor subfamily 0 group B member 2-like n=1 Tax=Rhinatrema bivittatum TaxID=194408 RepID=UPI00112AD574|nr:nuclear receptor subfamily 0 group B member 2-like [Rhinatrema bivittatum]
MASEVPCGKLGNCQCKTNPIDSILYQLLNQGQRADTGKYSQYHPSHHPRPWISTGGCPCGANRKVVLQTPEITCKRASAVLLKTVAFIRHLPSFSQLPREDQVLLIRRGWVPLFVLGLAQERVDFDLQELSVPSLLKQILLNQSGNVCDEKGTLTLGVPLAEVLKLTCFLGKFWNLDVRAKEYAYLKGIILFNPVIHGLRFPHYVQTFQQEAWRMLTELNLLMYSRSQARLNWILGTFTSLQGISASTIEELFFKPIAGEIGLEEVLLETLGIK